MDTLKNTADALTKSVSTEKFSFSLETMGVAGKGGHFEEYCRCIDKVCEH